VGEEFAFNQSLQEFENEEQHGDGYTDVQGPWALSQTPNSNTISERAEGFQCEECQDTFSKRYLLKLVDFLIPLRTPFDMWYPNFRASRSKHLKKHSPQFRCEIGACQAAFVLRKDLTRHQATSKHPEIFQESQRWYCPDPHCKYSIGRGDGIARRDNYRRHVQTQHGGAFRGSVE